MVQSYPAQVLVQLVDLRFVADRRVRIRRARPRLQRVLAALAMNVEQLFGLGVVGLEYFVAQGPGGRHAAGMLDLAEIALAQAQESAAVNLAVAADEVMQRGAEALALRVGPCLLRLVQP